MESATQTPATNILSPADEPASATKISTLELQALKAALCEAYRPAGSSGKQSGRNRKKM
jgi:hypothetical protein